MNAPKSLEEASAAARDALGARAHTPSGWVFKVDDKIGKVCELALGYQGGVGAFSAMARAYKVKPTNLWRRDDYRG